MELMDRLTTEEQSVLDKVGWLQDISASTAVVTVAIMASTENHEVQLYIR